MCVQSSANIQIVVLSVVLYGFVFDIINKNNTLAVKGLYTSTLNCECSMAISY